VELLRDLVRHDAFAAAFAEIIDEAADAPAADAHDPGTETWAAEKLRLGAMIDFLRGDYAAAVRRLELAALRYERLGPHPPLGGASCFAELADCRFYADPDHPAAAIADAARAIELAPDSRVGRELQQSVRRRQIHYHLAAGGEPDARAILRELAPASVEERILDYELGSRYRRLCESLLQRREAQTLRKPAEALFQKLAAWIHRALELNPTDAASHLMAADLAFYEGNDGQAARHLEDALRHGLSVEDAASFLDTALDKRPQSAPLGAIRDRLSQRETPPISPPEP
jgi:tetratricopeptide (TPR) repeat protein